MVALIRVVPTILLISITLCLVFVGAGVVRADDPNTPTPIRDLGIISPEQATALAQSTISVTVWASSPTPTLRIEASPTRTPPLLTFTPSPTISSSLPTLTPTRTGTAAPTATNTPLVSRTEIPDLGIITPTVEPMPMTINGVSLDTIILLPENAQQSIRDIYQRGQELGRNAQAFSKLGDSTIEPPHFMDRFDTGPYNLGTYHLLQATIDHYKGSFGRRSVAVVRGLHVWGVMNPILADPAFCAPNEHMLACEIRLHNPSVLFIRVGSNDTGTVQDIEDGLRKMLDYCIEQGVIPILGTKADRHEGSNAINETIRKLANEYALPLWDFDIAAGTLPGRGMDRDGIHLTAFYSHDWTQPDALTRGYGIHNITALIMLDRVRQTLETE
jgi:hypothetical protein